MRKSTILAAVIALAFTAACGAKDDDLGGDSQTKTGQYAVGDFVKLQVHREGFGGLTSFVTEGRVTSVDGAKATIEWTDKNEGDLSLIQWKDGANPEVVNYDFNEPTTANADKRECTYEPQAALSLTVPAGAFDCVQYSNTCKVGEDTIRHSGCDSNSIAVTQYVSYKKEWLGADGAVTKWYEKTLLENIKN